MPDSPKPTSSSPHPKPNTRLDSDELFGGPKPAERSFPTTAVTIAVIAVLVILGLLLIVGRRHGGTVAPGALQPAAAYATQLRLSDIALSESTSFSGGKETFVDGRITNAGPSTVTGVTVQVVFAPDGGGTPQIETVPLMLIRTRQPYVDTQAVSAAPLAPGAAAEFRLTFDDIRPEWNQQAPEIRVTHVTTR